MLQSKVSRDAIHAFLEQEFPQVADDLSVETMAPIFSVRLKVRDRHLRPGGTVSGPSLFMLADAGLYLGMMLHLGPVPLAVTTNATIDFLRKPQSFKDVIGEVDILKLGKRLVVGQVLMRSDGDDDLVARASLTYAIPPEK